MTFRPRQIRVAATTVVLWGALTSLQGSVEADPDPAAPVAAPPPIVDWMSLKHFIQPGAEVRRETATRLEVYQPTLDRSIVVTSEWTPDADIYRLPDLYASAQWVWAVTLRLLNDPERPRETWGRYFRAPFLRLVRLDRPDPLTTDLTTQPSIEVRPPDTAPVAIEPIPAETTISLTPTPAPPPRPETPGASEEQTGSEAPLPELQRRLTPPAVPQGPPGLGPTLGLSTGPEQVWVGVRFAALQVGRGGMLGAGVDLADGSGRTTAFVSLEGGYHLGIGGNRWRPYVGIGVGPTLNREVDGSQFSQIQARFRGGVSRILPNRRGAIFLELATAVNGPDLTLSAGWTLALHAPR